MQLRKEYSDKSMFNSNSKPGWFGSKLNDYKALLLSGNYSVIPWVFCVLAENNKALKKDAADMLCSALEKMNFDEIVRVDEQMRQTTSMEWNIDWRRLSFISLLTPEMSEAARRAVIVFASFNSNGFIRERAVRMMKNYDGTLQYAILRMNDWVIQIRDAACETADYRLSHLSECELTAALPFADKLSRSRRAQNADTYVKRLYTALTSKDNEKELLIGLSTANIRTRRMCTHALLNAECPRYDLATDRLKNEADPFLRATIFRRLVSAGQDLSILAEHILEDKYPLNRLLAYQYICSTNQTKALQLAEILLLDKSSAVREHVRFFLNKHVPDYDYRSYYKDHLNKCVTSAILGLGETGIAEDASEIESYLKSGQISIVRAAMIAVMRLESEKYSTIMTDFLTDDRAGIVKTARNLIIKTVSPNYFKVLDMFKTTPYLNTKRKCFSILLTASKWQRLIFILEVLESGSEEMTDPAKDELVRWIGSFNRSFALATPTQKEKITESIQRLDNVLSLKIRQEISFLLR